MTELINRPAYVTIANKMDLNMFLACDQFCFEHLFLKFSIIIIIEVNRKLINYNTVAK
jgi:hypothetical protein